MKKKDYQVVSLVSRSDRRALAEFLSQEGQLLLPMLELIEQAELAVDELIDVAGRATIEAVLTLSAQQLAGPKHPGQATGQIRWHGRQDGLVGLAERRLRVRKPRLRRKDRGQGAELEIPAYEAMQTNSRLGQRLLEILMHGVSTRHYRQVLPEMAETVGVRKSSVSREFIDASEKALKELAERRFDEQDNLIVYLDGLVFGEQHVIAAIGVDSKGYKHVLGLRDGASENATVCKALLADLVERGVKPGRRRLFVIDGSKALRAAIDAVYGKDNPVQRCRNHKRKNVLDHVSDPLKDTVKATMNAAYRLEADQGMARLEKLAKMLEKEHPSAAASLREGLSGVWADEPGVCSDRSGSAAAIRAACREADWKGLYFGSVALESDLGDVEACVAALEHVDVLAVRSRASREPPDVDVLRVLHEVRRRSPLAVVFDATPESVAAYLPYVDCVLAAPAPDDGPCELDPARVLELGRTIHAYSKQSR